MSSVPDLHAPPPAGELPVRKVVAGYFLSLDGVAEAPDRVSPDRPASPRER